MCFLRRTAGDALTGAPLEEPAQQIACHSRAAPSVRIVHVPANTTVVEITSRETFANVIHDGAVENHSSCQQTGSLRVTLRVSGCERERCCEVSRSL